MNPGIEAGAISYSSISSLEQQLQELAQDEQQDLLPARDDRGRLITIAPPSLWNPIGWLYGSSASSQPILDDISQFITSSKILMAKLDLVDRTIEEADPTAMGSLSVKGMSVKLEEFLKSPSGLLQMTQEHLEELLVNTLNQANNPEETLRFCHDELQTCHSRFLAATDETVDIQMAHAQFNKVVNDWLSEKGKELAGNPEAIRALTLVHERCSSFLNTSGRKVIQVTRSASPPPALQAASAATVTREAAASTINHQVAQNRAAIETMTIPETYPDAKDMLLDDLEFAHNTFQDELKTLQDDQPVAEWLEAKTSQLKKMRETMYYAVRSPDKKPPHHAGRVGLVNQRIDCEPNSHAQAYAHLSCYDYFLHRVYPVCPAPSPEEPILDRTEVDELNLQIQELENVDDDLRTQIENEDLYSRTDWASPEYREAEERVTTLKKSKEQVSTDLFKLKYKLEDSERSLENRRREGALDRRNQQYRHERDIENLPHQQHWRRVFQGLRNPPEGAHALTLHKPDEGSVYRADGFPDEEGGLIPKGYAARHCLLNPNNPASRDTIRTNDAKMFVSGGYGHWTCYLVNENGGVDHMNDSTVTRNRFPSREALLDHFNDKERYKKMQLTAIYE